MHVNLLTGQYVILILPLAILELILLVVALVDLLRREPGQVRGSKILWALVILLVGTVGPILYFVVGRKEA